MIDTVEPRQRSRKTSLFEQRKIAFESPEGGGTTFDQPEVSRLPNCQQGLIVRRIGS